MPTNRSNASDKPVRIIAVYADGRVQHRDAKNGRAPWTKGAGWGQPHAAAAPDEGPGDAPQPAATGTQPKPKDPRKVAAGKARAAQAKAQREEAARKAEEVKPKAAKRASKAATFADGLGARKPKRTSKAAESSDAMPVVAFRATREQKEKLAKLGGGDWLRRRIDAATVRA